MAECRRTRILDIFRLDADRFDCRPENRSLSSAAVGRGAGCRIYHHETGDSQSDQWRPTVNRMPSLTIAMVMLTALPYRAMGEPRSSARGERIYRACVACHSLEPNRNM